MKSATVGIPGPIGRHRQAPVAPVLTKLYTGSHIGLGAGRDSFARWAELVVGQQLTRMTLGQNKSIVKAKISIEHPFVDIYLFNGTEIVGIVSEYCCTKRPNIVKNA